MDESARGRLVAALTDALRRMIAEGDGEVARVVRREPVDAQLTGVEITQHHPPPGAAS